MIRMEKEFDDGKQTEENYRELSTLQDAVPQVSTWGRESAFSTRDARFEIGEAVITKFLQTRSQKLESYGIAILTPRSETEEKAYGINSIDGCRRNYHLFDTALKISHGSHDKDWMFVDAYNSSRIIRHQRFDEFRDLVELIGGQK